MKRFIYIFITLLWMISYATAQETLPCRGTATTVLNVRSGPGTSYARVGQLSRGQEVNVIQKSSNNWVQIEFDSQRGYAYSKYLKFSPLPQKANSPPAKSSSGSSSWSFWKVFWSIIIWGIGILPRTGRALLGVQGTAYCLFHRISCIHIHLQNNQPSFFLAECFATIYGKTLVYLLQKEQIQQ